MREQFIQLLVKVLANNIGNRITDELATGMATVINQALLAPERSEAESAPRDSGA